MRVRHLTMQKWFRDVQYDEPRLEAALRDSLKQGGSACGGPAQEGAGERQNNAPRRHLNSHEVRRVLH